MQRILFFILFNLCCNSIFAQTFTITGNVYNDPDAGSINGSASPFSLPPENLQVVLIKVPEATIFRTAAVSYIDGSFTFSSVPEGSYYAMVITPNANTLMGATAPPAVLETGWTRTGESLESNGDPDALIDGKTEIITVTGSNISDVKFGIQERPFARNKMNNLFDNTVTGPELLSVNTGSVFGPGSSDILEGADYGGGFITHYTINVLPKYGTLYLGSTEVTSLAQVASLTPATFSSLAYLPHSTALAHEQDFFTYYVTDNASTKSNNATYVIPFPLLDGDGDTYANRTDLDDDNDGITDVDECPLNDLGNLSMSYLNNEFTSIKPSHFGYSIEHNTGLNLSADLSHLFGYQLNSGAVIVTVSNANTHPTADEFYVNDSTGASQWTISGTVGSYTAIEHGQEYFSYDTRTITLLNSGTIQPYHVMWQEQDDEEQENWSFGNNGYSWWLTNDNPATNPSSVGLLAIALTDPGPKYFQVASTANNRDEWATYFIRILPECDYDMDGIPNRLDLDSDNDGCLDALEGSVGFDYTGIDDAGGTVWAGTGSPAENQNLCADVNCVDTNGIPLTAAGGQTPDETYNEEQMSEACKIAMPVTLVAFNVHKVEQKALLVWTTVSEYNSKGFDIERSTDGRNWMNIGFTVSQSENGNSHVQSAYTFTDNAPAGGQNLYRLKQTDLDGKFEYSHARAVWFENISNISIYPNPVSNTLNIKRLKGNENIRIYDVTGRLLIQQKAENTSPTISLDQLGAGVYFLSITGADGTISSHKVIKNK